MEDARFNDFQMLWLPPSLFFALARIRASYFFSVPHLNVVSLFLTHSNDRAACFIGSGFFLAKPLSAFFVSFLIWHI